MTRAILLPVVLLIIGLFLFGIIQYFSIRKKEAHWAEDKKLLEEALSEKTTEVKELESWISSRRW